MTELRDKKPRSAVVNLVNLSNEKSTICPWVIGSNQKIYRHTKLANISVILAHNNVYLSAVLLVPFPTGSSSMLQLSTAIPSNFPRVKPIQACLPQHHIANILIIFITCPFDIQHMGLTLVAPFQD